ncbi:Mannose-6-phosphate isomerase [Alteripontixanthobacter maritimus]|uniref:Mannose-6-phosphate isomerase n=1 Tax=Alteripontixanthobacter maritimus TaxID=2161824 RepID=A0A369QAX6_9SPHN|nr:class I mannose-6-phosphate isomerase [Alteripontixanthobacter maritimus]RDC60695.1 Mannose-6-phosphate isomerase [Alteripontixanthobacter maritimus]
MTAPYLLQTRMVEKVWGVAALPPPFADKSTSKSDSKIGEIWFEPTADNSDLLVKYLFTSDKLSVQVHPSDAHAGEGESGKEECWYVLTAEPDAALGIGLTSECSKEELRAAALDGSIENLLDWRPVCAGDFFYLPAGTIHAIGPGLTLLEVQQNSETTYRLYDYGRPRELHLADGISVANRGPYDAANTRKVPATGDVTLVDGPHFRMTRSVEQAPDDYRNGALVVPLDGLAQIGHLRVEAGQCGWAPDVTAIDLSSCPSAMIVAR